MVAGAKILFFCSCSDVWCWCSLCSPPSLSRSTKNIKQLWVGCQMVLDGCRMVQIYVFASNFLNNGLILIYFILFESSWSLGGMQSHVLPMARVRVWWYWMHPAPSSIYLALVPDGSIWHLHLCLHLTPFASGTSRACARTRACTRTRNDAYACDRTGVCHHEPSSWNFYDLIFSFFLKI